MTSLVKQAIIEKLQSDDTIELCCLGKAAPAFEADALMPDASIKKVTLKDYKGKWLALCFYPLDFSLVCGSEVCGFSDRARNFQEEGCEVLLCSVDSVFSHKAWCKLSRTQGGVGQCRFPLLSDITKKIAQDYGVLHEAGSDHQGLAMRATFLIDPSGTLRHASTNELAIGRNIDEVLRLMQAYAQHDATGDVLPAGWKPGMRSVSTTPAAATATAANGTAEETSKHRGPASFLKAVLFGSPKTAPDGSVFSDMLPTVEEGATNTSEKRFQSVLQGSASTRANTSLVEGTSGKAASGIATVKGAKPQHKEMQTQKDHEEWATERQGSLELGSP